MPLAIGALVLSACGGGGGDDQGATEDEPEATAVSAQDINTQDRADLAQGGTIRLDVPDFGANWNPLHVDGNNNDLRRVREPLLPSFFVYDAKGVATPDPDFLVSATEVSKTPTVINYKLNPKAVWGDGSVIDADDMIATWKACNGADKDFACATTDGFNQIADVKAGADKLDVTVTYKAAYPDWTAVFSVDGAVLKAESVKDAQTFNTGWKTLKNEWLSGPYKVGSLDTTQKVLTEVPNERWWGEKPLLDTITFRTISPDAVAAAYVNNELDGFDIGVDPDAFQRAGGVTDGTIRKAGGPNFRHFTFNSKAGVLADRVVRQAIVRGLDRQAIASSDLAGIDWPARPLNNNLLLEGQEGFEDMGQRTGLDYDPEKAKADLDAAGWTAGSDGIREKAGKKLAVKFMQLGGVSVSENEALQAQSLLKEIGVKVDIVTVPIEKFQDGSVLSKHEFEIIAFSWIGTPYPFRNINQIYGTGSESNYAQLSMPDLDALIKRIDVETDPPTRTQLGNDAAAMIWENVHTLPLYQRPELVAVKSKVANWGAFGLSSVQWENVGYQK